MPHQPDDDAEAASPFAFPAFTAVWVTSLISNLGSLIQSVGASWYLGAHAASATTVTLLQVAASAPIVLFSLPAGAMADNFDRRRIMLYAQIFMLAVSVALAVAGSNGLLTPAILLAATFAIGCGNALSAPSWQASVGDLVAPPAIARAISWNSMGFNAARSLGPAVGGVIVAAFGINAAFASNALSYIGFILVLARYWPAKPASRLPHEPVASAMASGLRFAAVSPTLRPIFVVSGTAGLACAAIPALLPVLSRSRLGNSAQDLGILLGAFGVGAVLGGLLSAKVNNRDSIPRSIAVASIAAAAGACLLGSGTSSTPLLIAALLLVGAGWVFVLALLNILVQTLTPRGMTGRALALLQMAAFAGSAIGSGLSGVIATRLGLSLAFFASALLQCLPILFAQALAHIQADAAASSPASEPAPMRTFTANPALGTTGPMHGITDPVTCR